MGQCKSVTRTGERCKRQAIPGRHYCWQHESRLFQSITLTGIVAALLAIIGLAADLTGLGLLPTLQPVDSKVPSPSASNTQRVDTAQSTFISGGVESEGAESSTPELEVDLLLRIGGFEIRVLNTGNALASQVYVDVVSWQINAPGISIRDTYPMRDLIPKSDFTLNVELIEWDSPEYNQYRRQKPTSGYIVAVCNNCERPKAWAFYIPGQGSEQQKDSNSRFRAVHFPALFHISQRTCIR